MSIQAITWAREQTLPVPHKLVLLSLAALADKRGICWPSVSKVSKRTGQSARNVQQILRELKQLHLLIVRIRTEPRGNKRARQYRLCLSIQPHLEKLTEDGLASREPESTPTEKLKPTITYISDLPRIEQIDIAEMLQQLEEKERKYWIYCLAKALSKKAIRGSASAWLAGGIRRRELRERKCALARERASRFKEDWDNQRKN